MSDSNLQGLSIVFVMYLVLFFVGLIYAIVFCVFLWKVFVKAGRPGWAALIPFYNVWNISEIGTGVGWWALGLFIPYVGSIFMFYIYFKFFKAYNLFTAMCIVGMFIPIIPVIMIAVSDNYVYLDPYNTVIKQDGFDNIDWG